MILALNPAQRRWNVFSGREKFLTNSISIRDATIGNILPRIFPRRCNFTRGFLRNDFSLLLLVRQNRGRSFRPL